MTFTKGKKDINCNDGHSTPCDLWSRNTIRLQIAFLLSFAMAICGLLRGHLGMALVCMMKIDQNASHYVYDDSYTSSLQVEWSLSNVGQIHTAFYVGTFIPCASLLIAKWFPMHEKSTAMAIFSMGNQVGLALAMFATAELCKVRYLDGWPTSFFLYGLMGAVFIGIWLPNVKNKPRENRWISSAELMHIEESEQRLRAMSVNLNVPYRTLFCSPVIIAICLSSFCQSFVMVSMISYLPEYYRSVLKLGISANGSFSAIPFLVQMFSKMGFAFVADRLKVLGLKINFVTKICNSIASFGCAICLILICFTNNGTIIMMLICLGLTFTSAFVPGYNTSIVSVAPSYTAVISAYAQIWAQTASVFAPLIVGWITQTSSVNEWRAVFVIIAAVCIVTGITFQIFGAATVQPWAIPHFQTRLNASTFTVHMAASELSLNIAPTMTTLHHPFSDDDEGDEDTPRTSFLDVPQRIPKRSPKVSIMEEEDGEITYPGEPVVLKKISE
uniref:Major facilitator superfamily (MFS) profile domain-containing protein n=1 Tax=Panagrolaimus sp. ES5 TaxID=591445 RepID=A0AC34G2L6_9BILA